MSKWIARALMLVMLCSMAVGVHAEERKIINTAKEIVLEMFNGDPAKVYEQFSEEVAAQLPLDQLMALPQQLQAAGGDFKGIGEVRQGDSEIIVTAHMETMNLLIILSFDEQGKIMGMFFLPDSANPEDIPMEANEEKVSVGQHGLSGILTVPAGEKLPAVVLVHGSGPNDRNEAAMGTMIFRDIAKGLSEKGIAVLRYDKLTFAMNQGAVPVDAETIANLTIYDETVVDALEAVKLLREDPRIDPERIFIIGHSQGAIAAPWIHNEGANARGLILLAGTMRPIAELFAEQLEAANADMYAAEIAAARALLTATEEEARQESVLGGNAYMLWEQAQHDWKAYAEEAETSMLILQGSEDVQVFAERDYPLWETFAKERPDRDIKLVTYEGLGHLFVEGDVFSQKVLEDIAAWILER